MNAPNLESATPNPSPDRRVVVHDLTIEDNRDSTGEDVIASCLCGWFDDECYSPSDAARRWEAHCDRVLSHDCEPVPGERTPAHAALNANQTTIKPGDYRHDTRLGTIMVNVQLADTTVEALCAAMERAGLTPTDVYSAIPDGETRRWMFKAYHWGQDGRVQLDQNHEVLMYEVIA